MTYNIYDAGSSGYITIQTLFSHYLDAAFGMSASVVDTVPRSLCSNYIAPVQTRLVYCTARHNLTVSNISGGSARFIAGGELPVPFSSGLGTVSVGFKEYGVKFDVSPVASSFSNGSNGRSKGSSEGFSIRIAERPRWNQSRPTARPCSLPFR